MTVTTTKQIVCLSHNGKFFYFIPRDMWHNTVWRAEAGAGVSEVLSPTPYNKLWYVGSVLADRLVKVSPAPLLIVRWQLRDPTAVSERFPEFFTPEEMSARKKLITHQEEESIESSLYTAITEAQPDTEEVIEGPWIMADGELPPDDGLTWVSKLPYQLVHHAELRHLYPGHLTGFRAALAISLNEIPGVSAYDQGMFTVYIKTPYHPARTKWHGRLLASGKPSTKTGKMVEEKMTRSLTINPAREIHGTDRADAVSKWNVALEEYVSIVSEIAAGRACGTCGGTGIAPIPFVSGLK